MSDRRAVALLTLFLAAPALRAEPTGKLGDLLDGTGTAALTLEAPLQQLFQKGANDESVVVPGTLTYKAPTTGTDVVLRDVDVSVRGHTSRLETECTFPKLKLKAKQGGGVKLGTHCGEAADEHLTAQYGRLANEKSPWREAVAYKILDALGVPSLRTRPARVTYIDPAGGGAPLARNALLVEDDDASMKRVGGTAEIPMEKFGSVKTRGASEDGARIAFGEAAIGNFDWCLKFTPDDMYRCDDSKPLWNILAFDRGGGRTALIMKDLDLAGVVVGTHGWFKTVFNPAFLPSGSEIDVEVMSQVQRTRSLFTRAELDTLRRGFTSRKTAAYDAIDKAEVDPRGREIARAHLDAFFKAIDDAAFYRPVVAKTDVQVYRDAARTKEACGPTDTLRVGTPVNVVQQSGTMSQVTVLDALWRWGAKNSCEAVRSGPVWIQSDAITAQYPQ